MATATVTKLNSKLPTVSKIAFCTSAGVNMCTELFAGDNGQFSRLVGFKQNKKTYPYQVQYRQRSRYTPSNEKVTGALWNNWSDWKAAVGVSDIPAQATETDKPVNKWMKANKGINKNGTYQLTYTFENYLIPADYDARQFQFRIRTVNKAQAKHGSFTSQVLTVYKKPIVADGTAIASADGGLKIKFNYQWERNASIIVSSVVDATGRELLNKEFTAGVQRVELGSGTVPASRQNYTGGMVAITIDKLKRKVEEGETLTFNVHFVSEDGASIPVIESGAVVQLRRAMSIGVTHTWDQVKGVLKVVAANEGSVALVDVGANVSYTYNSKEYSLAPVKEEIDLTGASTFYFYPPIDTAVAIHIKMQDADDYKGIYDGTQFVVSAKGYRLNKSDDVNICGICWGNPSFQVSADPQYETALPYGREKNVIFYGKGTTIVIRLSATLVDKDGLLGGDYGKKAAWEMIQNNQGVYYFRTNQGQLYKVGLTGLSLKHNKKDVYDLSVDMVEVV